MSTARTDTNLRRRLHALAQDIKVERNQEIARALECKSKGDLRKADYHTGLADGRNSVLASLRLLTHDSPAGAEAVDSFGLPPSNEPGAAGAAALVLGGAR